MDPKASSNPPRPKYAVTFVLPDGEEYQADAREGDSLVLASGRSEYPISTGCMDSSCGTCEVVVLAGMKVYLPLLARRPPPKKPIKLRMHIVLAVRHAVLGEGVKVQIVNVLGADGDF